MAVDQPSTKVISDELADLGNTAFDVGARLRALRLAYGLSQREVARKAQITNGSLSQIESGSVSPSVVTLEKLARVFELSLPEFFANSLQLSPTIILEEHYLKTQLGSQDIRVAPICVNKNQFIFLLRERLEPGACIDFTNSLLKLENVGPIQFITGVIEAGEAQLSTDRKVYHLQKGHGFNMLSVRKPVLSNRSGSRVLVTITLFC